MFFYVLAKWWWNERKQINQSPSRCWGCAIFSASHWSTHSTSCLWLAEMTVPSISTHQMRANWQRFLAMIDHKPRKIQNTTYRYIFSAVSEPPPLHPSWDWPPGISAVQALFPDWAGRGSQRYKHWATQIIKRIHPLLSKSTLNNSFCPWVLFLFIITAEVNMFTVSTNVIDIKSVS